MSFSVIAAEQTLTVQINQGSDDMEEWLGGQSKGATDFDSSDLELGSDAKDGTSPQLIGLRFQNITIPKNAKINSAYIEFELDATSKNTDPFEMHIWAENTDNALTFTGTSSVLNEVTSRLKLTDSIQWVLTAGDFNTVDTKKQTSNIALLLQKLVSRTNWVSGNAVAFYLKGKGTREVESYEGEPTAATKLIINYDNATTDLSDAKQSVSVIANSNSNTILVTGVDNVKSLMLYNLNGQICASSTNALALDVEGTSAGIYILKINTLATSFCQKVQIVK